MLKYLQLLACKIRETDRERQGDTSNSSVVRNASPCAVYNHHNPPANADGGGRVSRAALFVCRSAAAGTPRAVAARASLSAAYGATPIAPGVGLCTGLPPLHLRHRCESVLGPSLYVFVDLFDARTPKYCSTHRKMYTNASCKVPGFPVRRPKVKFLSAK